MASSGRLCSVRSKLHAQIGTTRAPGRGPEAPGQATPRVQTVSVRQGHISEDVARAFAADKWATRCDEMTCALICAEKRLRGLSGGVRSPGGSGGVDSRPLFGQAWPGDPLDRRSSSHSAGCTKNQPRRPVLRPFRGHVLVLPGSRLHAKVWQGVRTGALSEALVLPGCPAPRGSR